MIETIINFIKNFFTQKSLINVDIKNSNSGNNGKIKGNSNTIGDNNINIRENNSGINIVGDNNKNCGNTIGTLNINQLNSSNKEEEIKDEIVKKIISLTALLKRHCINAPSLSEGTEKDPTRNKDLNNEEIVKIERERIDMEMTSLFRELNNNIELFEFYSKNTSLIKDLTQYSVRMWQYAHSINLFIMYKFSYYFLHEDNNYFFEKLQKVAPEMLKISEDIDREKQDILEKLKNSKNKDIK